MSTWQIVPLFAVACCTIGCLVVIYKAIERLSKGVFSIGAELTKINSKLAAIEAVSRDDPQSSITQNEIDASIEAALRNLEKL